MNKQSWIINKVLLPFLQVQDATINEALHLLKVRPTDIHQASALTHIITKRRENSSTQWQTFQSNNPAAGCIASGELHQAAAPATKSGFSLRSEQTVRRSWRSFLLGPQETYPPCTRAMGRGMWKDSLFNGLTEIASRWLTSCTLWISRDIHVYT